MNRSYLGHRRTHASLRVAAAVSAFALVGSAFGQTAAEHASHHPGDGGAPSVSGAMPMPGGGNPAPAASATSSPPAPSSGAMGGDQPTGAGGGMGGMGEMMNQMGKPPTKELYPSLMALPDEVTPEQRAGIEQLAQDRMKTGTATLSTGLAKLSDSTSSEDYAAMQQAAEQMREGLAQFEAGIAARRVLSEGKAPRNLALDWFKREMNLASFVGPEGPRTLLGVSPFHLFTMALLVAFALAMLAMYYFKMRRAAALFGRIDPDRASPDAKPGRDAANG